MLKNKKTIKVPGTWTPGPDGLVPLDAAAKAWLQKGDRDEQIENGAVLFYELRAVEHANR